jgi:ATP-dependent RNA helicase DDX49/DBP8
VRSNPERQYAIWEIGPGSDTSVFPVTPARRRSLIVQVLDEADRLLTPTFAPDLSFIFSQIPPQRQTCLFTATVSDAIMELANKTPAPGKQKPFVYRVESE